MDSDFQIKNIHKEKIILGKYQILKNIEKNQDLQVYEGKNIISDELIIIKIEQKKDKKKKGILEIESHYLNYLKSPGIPIIKKIGYFGNNIISIQPILGFTLFQLFTKYCGNFKIKDIIMIAIQILERIKFIHNKNVIYCNINPNNFALGFGRFQNLIYMTNFKLAKRYRDKNTLEHIKYNISNDIKENYIFASINSLRGVEFSRRDDLESLGYMLIYFLKGGLPWEHIKCLNNSEKKRKIYQIKKTYNLSELCKGVPEEFKLFLNYVKSLNFMEDPDYNYCFSLFYGIFKKMNIINDGIFTFYQEKNKEVQNKIKQFYNKLWFNKYFNHNTSTTSIFNEIAKNKNLLNTSNDIIRIKKSNSCFLNVHNSISYVLNTKNNINNSEFSLIKNNSDLKDIKVRKNNNSLNTKIHVNSLKKQKSKEIESNGSLKEGENNSSKSLSSEKEYSIEGKIEQEEEKIKTYEKKQIGINIKKSFNKTKNNENQKKEMQNELLRIKKRIINKKQKDDKKYINTSLTQRNYLSAANNTYNNNKDITINKDINNKNIVLQNDILYTDYMKKTIPYIKYGNTTAKNSYLKNKINFYKRNDKRNKEYISFTSFSHIKNKNKKSRINNLDSISNSNNDDINYNLNDDNNSRKKPRKLISLNLDNIILNTQRLSNISNKVMIKNKDNSLNNQKLENTYKNSLNNILNKESDRPEKIKVVKKNMNKTMKPENYHIYNKNKSNIYQHKSSVNNSIKAYTYKKNSTSLIKNTNKNLEDGNIRVQKFCKKINGKTFKNIPLSKINNSTFSKKRFTISINKNSDKNKRLVCGISTSQGKKAINADLENEINNIEKDINNTENNIYNTFRNNNTIFSNFNKIRNNNIKDYNYIYTKNKKAQNTESKNKNSKKQKEIFQKYVKIENSPIIHNSISKLNLIQNVSNIYVTKSYLEEKPLTERKNKVLVSRVNKNRNIYIKPKSKISSHDWALLNKNNITNLILEMNNKNNIGNNSGNIGEDNFKNYYFSELNIFNEK